MSQEWNDGPGAASEAEQQAFTDALHKERAQQERQDDVTEATLGAVVHVVFGTVIRIDTDHKEVHLQRSDDNGSTLIAALGDTPLTSAALQQQALVLVPQDSRQAVFDVLWIGG